MSEEDKKYNRLVAAYCISTILIPILFLIVIISIIAWRNSLTPKQAAVIISFFMILPAATGLSGIIFRLGSSGTPEYRYINFFKNIGLNVVSQWVDNNKNIVSILIEYTPWIIILLTFIVQSVFNCMSAF